MLIPGDVDYVIMTYCKTKINTRSNVVESVYQSKTGNPLIADKGDKTFVFSDQ